MCGIAGILHLNDRPCGREDIQPLIDQLSHRGPDGEGIHVDGRVGLGHRRLAILDRSAAGKQPLQFLGRYWITYNGEVYNFVELRQELESLGHHFFTDTDTEVVVAAYHQWGPGFVMKMNGMWAFAIWDSQERELFLSRDRFGVKPLHYLAEPHRFVFASELKSFLRLSGFTARENLMETHRQLTGVESTEETLLENVKLLRAGHNMVVSTAGMRVWRWWSTLEHLVQVPKQFTDQAEQFRELFFDACRVRLRSDVPVGTCLSGGMDSSSILCSVAASSNRETTRVTNDYHRAFVATFQGTSHDEREYAEAAIETAAADATFCAMDPAALVDDLPQYAYDFELIGQGLLLPVWSIYREIRRNGIMVTLDGLGADELMMGYGPPLRKYLMRHGSLLRHPIRTLDLALTLRRQLREASLGRIVCQADPFLGKVRLMAGLAKRFIRGVPGQKASAPNWIPPVTGGDAMDEAEKEALNSLSPINQELYCQFHHGVNASLLRKYDRVSMAHGIEVRMPFLDWRLVTYCFSLPDESKVGHGYAKRILREAMRGVLPEKIRTRTVKIGFQSPLVEWMNGALGDWVVRRVQTKRFLESPISNAPGIRDFVIERHARRNWDEQTAYAVWRHLQADLWRETFFTRAHAARVGQAFRPNAERVYVRQT